MFLKKIKMTSIENIKCHDYMAVSICDMVMAFYFVAFGYIMNIADDLSFKSIANSELGCSLWLNNRCYNFNCICCFMFLTIMSAAVIGFLPIDDCKSQVFIML